jgi:hypothetical protein
MLKWSFGHSEHYHAHSPCRNIGFGEETSFYALQIMCLICTAFYVSLTAPVNFDTSFSGSDISYRVILIWRLSLKPLSQGCLASKGKKTVEKELIQKKIAVYKN